MKKQVNVKGKIMGDGNVTVQTMLSRKTIEVEKNLEEIAMLKNEGCDFVRIAVSDEREAEAFGKICEKSLLPVIADIQFDYRLAIKTIENGAAKIRINPFYIGGED